MIGLTADNQIDNGPAALLATTTPHLADRDAPDNRVGNLQVSSRIGQQFGDLSLGVSGRMGNLDDDDAAYLAARFPTYDDDRDFHRWGVDAMYKKAPYILSVQYGEGDTGGIENDGYEILLGVEPSKECTGLWRDLSPACKGIFVRYTKMDIDVPATVGSVWDAITWDTEQLAVSYVLPLKLDNAGFFKWLQFEYERNKEDAPAGAEEIPNDIFFVELFTAF